MTRGAIRPTTALEAAERARSMIAFVPQVGGKPILYRLKGGYNGGKNPFAPHPASWSPPDSQGLAWSARGAWTCDCSGFAAWALGLDRFQPDTAIRWVETSRMILDSRGDRPELFAEVEYPELGAVAVYGDRGGRQGHVGIVVEVPAEWDVEHPQHELVRVVHCSTGNQRRTGAAIAETDATLWRRRGGVWLRYLRAS